ncbi:MAG: hypothetical protein JWP87_5578 [Labilithrix sp.]|nr:hypothetical protein [Labilithrix sp.]
MVNEPDLTSLASVAPVVALVGAFVALLPIAVIATIWKRRPWLGLVVTGRSAGLYASAVLLIAVPTGLIAGVLFDARRGALTTFVLGLLYAYRGSLVLDALHVERVLRAIGNGDRAEAVALATRGVRRLERFRNLVGVKLSWGIVSLISGVGLLEDAERILGAVPCNRYLGPALWCLQHALASLRIRMGRFDQATATLDFCQGKAPSAPLEEEHRYLRALVDVSTGHVERAKKRIKDTDKPEHREQLRAHAAAALGDDDEARAALERVSKLLYGPTMVEMIANGYGPAKRVALRLVGREPEAD